MTLSERIRLRRLQRGLSQENMADLLHLSTTAYGDIERGKTDLTLSRLSQIAAVFDLSPAALLTDEEPLTPAEAVPLSDPSHELETLRLTVEKQQLELEKLRLETDYWKRRYEDRIAFELARALGQEPVRERIGF
ncbi:helix-turn-helix domain-containing protein [Rudanella lutea]|uniref:helix-turn-helix domain-containing protein n=1 Tax=Rudanella lutea TaxID=451374 RepID=UPI000361B86B|nr:helix-turn-helix transcriptional regulator [Rudanella lutea]